MEVNYKLRANELTMDLMESIQRLFGNNEIIISVSGEAEETTGVDREIPLRPGEFKERVQNLRPGEQIH